MVTWGDNNYYTQIKWEILPWISPKRIMVKRGNDKCGIHYFCHCNHITYLQFNEGSKNKQIETSFRKLSK